jgi:5-methyltetrahydrofolate--homocysteine methyltransferase
MVDSYYAQVAALVEAGADILLPETVIDTLNLKACLFAISKYIDDKNVRVPVMVSGTFDKGGATFVSGQDVEAFWTAVAHFPMLSVGMNCALGPELMRPHLERLQEVSPRWISCHPNAGLPNEFGQYDLGPADMAAMVGEFAERGWVNIVGGCCGTGPEHIRAIAETMRKLAPHRTTTVASGRMTRARGSSPGWSRKRNLKRRWKLQPSR